MNAELRALYEADYRDHGQGLQHSTPEYDAMRARDRDRRQRAAEIIAEIMAGESSVAAEDYYHAAWLFNHGDTPDDASQGHVWAKQAAELGHRPARWLAAAAYDRARMYSGQPQKYGTQFVPDGTRHRLWDVEPATTDAERAAWDVPPLAEQLRRAEAMTEADPPGPIGEGAPTWLTDAIERWRAEEAA
ncbi:MAG: hypothetical protein AAF624_11625 [Bacteroidota bacterium]